MTHWNKNFVFDLVAFAPDVFVWREGGLRVNPSFWTFAAKIITITKIITKKTTTKTV